MSISVIRATFDCDGCGKQFRVDMDPASRVDAEIFPTLFEEAEDCVRGGTTSDGKFCSVQAKMHLCDTCTSAADSIGDENYAPNHDEIMRAIAKAESRS